MAAARSRRFARKGRKVSELNKLDDPDYPAFTIGQAAELLSVQQAFLRSLDTADVVSPHRSPGGHRRYSRRQLELVSRLREQLDNGHTLSAASHILDLEDELAAARADLKQTQERLRAAEEEIAQLRAQLADATGAPAEQTTQAEQAEQTKTPGEHARGEAAAGDHASQHGPDDANKEDDGSDDA